jgi:hypothetical protein
MEPTFGAFYTELRYVYEQKKMYPEWFAILDKLNDVNDQNRQAFLNQDWKEFVRICSASCHFLGGIGINIETF